MIRFLAIAIILFSSSSYGHEPPEELVSGSDLRIEYLKKLSEGKCNTNGEVDRHLLQQNWFFDELKTDHGMIFAQHGFSDYSTFDWSRASYCIDGNTINATFYSSQSSYNVNGEPVQEEAFIRIRSLPTIKMIVEELTENRLIFSFPNNDEKLILYR